MLAGTAERERKRSFASLSVYEGETVTVSSRELNAMDPRCVSGFMGVEEWRLVADEVMRHSVRAILYP